MKSYLFQPPTLIDMPLVQLKVTVKALYKKIKGFDGVVTTHILKKAFDWFRASDKESWLRVYAELLDRDEKLDKDIVKIKHEKFSVLLRILNKKDILKTKESDICFGDYEVSLSYRWTNRRGDLSYAHVGRIGYCTWKCKFYFCHLNSINKIYFSTAKEMLQVVIASANKLK